MGAVMPQVNGKADGNQVNANRQRIIREGNVRTKRAVSILLDAYGFFVLS